MAKASLYSPLASVHDELHQPRQEGHRAGRRLQSQSVRERECVCVSHSFILSVLFVHLDVLIFKREDLC